MKRGHAAAFETPKDGPVADIAEQLERVAQQKESRSSGRKVKDRGAPVEDKPSLDAGTGRSRRSAVNGGFRERLARTSVVSRSAGGRWTSHLQVDRGCSASTSRSSPGTHTCGPATASGTSVSAGGLAAGFGGSTG